MFKEVMENVVYFNTEREAETSLRKYKKYKPTSNYRWVVQGNALVRIPRERYDFSSRELSLINKELSRGRLETRRFYKVAKSNGGYVEIWKDKKTGKKYYYPTNIKRLKFKLKVAKTR